MCLCCGFSEGANSKNGRNGYNPGPGLFASPSSPTGLLRALGICLTPHICNVAKNEKQAVWSLLKTQAIQTYWLEAGSPRHCGAHWKRLVVQVWHSGQNAALHSHLASPSAYCFWLPDNAHNAYPEAIPNTWGPCHPQGRPESSPWFRAWPSPTPDVTDIWIMNQQLENPSLLLFKYIQIIWLKNNGKVKPDFIMWLNSSIPLVEWRKTFLVFIVSCQGKNGVTHGQVSTAKNE